MSSSISIPLNGSAVRFIPEVDEARAKKSYADGKPTGAAKVDASGRALWGFNAVVELNGQRLGTVGIESPTQLPALPFGSVLVGQGAAELRVSNQRDAFDLRATLVIESFAVAGTEK